MDTTKIVAKLLHRRSWANPINRAVLSDMLEDKGILVKFHNDNITCCWKALIMALPPSKAVSLFQSLSLPKYIGSNLTNVLRFIDTRDSRTERSKISRRPSVLRKSNEALVQSARLKREAARKVFLQSVCYLLEN